MDVTVVSQPWSQVTADWLVAPLTDPIDWSAPLKTLDQAYGGVVYEPVRGWLFGLPLPSSLRPQVAARESVADGTFQFDVEIGAPLIGRIIRYRGWLRPVSAEKPVGDLAPGNQAGGAPAE